MKIENPEYIMDTCFDGEETPEAVVLPKGLPGKKGATILMISNLKYFLEMFGNGDDKYYLHPYEILAELEKQVMEDAMKGEINYCYLIGYKRDQSFDGDVIFDFSHFEVNAETEPDENYRSLYIYYEYTGSAS